MKVRYEYRTIVIELLFYLTSIYLLIKFETVMEFSYFKYNSFNGQRLTPSGRFQIVLYLNLVTTKLIYKQINLFYLIVAIKLILFSSGILHMENLT